MDDAELKQWACESNEEFQRELDADYDAQVEPTVKYFEKKGPPTDHLEGAGNPSP